MKLNYFVVLIFYLSIANAHDIDCTYSYNNPIYNCRLIVHNSGGLDNFTEISGDHVGGRSYGNVNQLDTASGTCDTPIFPSVICDKFPNLQTILFNSQKLKWIGENAFKKCVHLRNLQLGSNIIETINQDAFYFNTQLETLSLSGNKLEIIPENVFINQANLVDLYLSSNQLVEIRSTVFANLKKLDVLWINSNKLENLPRGLFRNLFDMTDLRIHDNNITVINADSFGFRSNLDLFYFQKINLTAFDERIIDNSKVKTIDTTSNPCSNKSGAFTDNSPHKDTIKEAMQQCFGNYKHRCDDGQYLSRICGLERDAYDAVWRFEYLEEMMQRIISQKLDERVKYLEDLFFK